MWLSVDRLSRRQLGLNVLSPSWVVDTNTDGLGGVFDQSPRHEPSIRRVLRFVWTVTTGVSSPLPVRYDDLCMNLSISQSSNRWRQVSYLASRFRVLYTRRWATSGCNCHTAASECTVHCKYDKLVEVERSWEQIQSHLEFPVLTFITRCGLHANRGNQVENELSHREEV